MEREILNHDSCGLGVPSKVKERVQEAVGSSASVRVAGRPKAPFSKSTQYEYFDRGRVLPNVRHCEVA
jgi:hypothetical protein